MTRIAIVTVLAAASLTAPAPAQGWAEKMFKDGLTHDFGSQPRGAQLSKTFTITNIYAVPMEITSIKSGCGCVTAEPKKRVLQPREATTVEVVMDTKRFTGPKTVGVRVTVGPNFISSAEIQVKAISRTDLVFNPGQVTFGTLTRGQTPSQSVDVEYAGALPWQVSEVVAKGVPFKVTFKESYRRPGAVPGTNAVGYRLTVTMDGAAPVGVHRHNVYLKTNDTASPLVPVLIEATVQSAVTVTPETLNLDRVKVGTAVVRRVVVRGSQPFRVTEVQGAGDGFELGEALSPSEGLVQFVTFKCEPGREGAFKRELKIKTTLQEAPVVVTIEGTAAK